MAPQSQQSQPSRLVQQMLADSARPDVDRKQLRAAALGLLNSGINPSPVDVVSLHIVIASTYRKNYEAAADHYADAIEVASTNGLTKYVIRAKLGLYQLHKRSGDEEAAGKVLHDLLEMGVQGLGALATKFVDGVGGTVDETLSGLVELVTTGANGLAKLFQPSTADSSDDEPSDGGKPKKDEKKAKD